MWSEDRRGSAAFNVVKPLAFYASTEAVRAGLSPRSSISRKPRANKTPPAPRSPATLSASSEWPKKTTPPSAKPRAPPIAWKGWRRNCREMWRGFGCCRTTGHVAAGARSPDAAQRNPGAAVDQATIPDSGLRPASGLLVMSFMLRLRRQCATRTQSWCISIVCHRHETLVPKVKGFLPAEDVPLSVRSSELTIRHGDKRDWHTHERTWPVRQLCAAGTGSMRNRRTSPPWCRMK